MKDIISSDIVNYYTWHDVTNIGCPVHYTDNLSADRGVFNEENGEKYWKLENGELSCDRLDGDTLTCIHVYEKNVCFKACVRIAEADSSDAVFGMLLRYNAEHAYCRIGYFVQSQLWVLDAREGKDQPCIRYGTKKKCPMSADERHDITFTVNGDRASLIVDGETVLEVSGIVHTSPGRIGFFTNRTNIAVADVDIALLSGQGVVWRNTKHTMLPIDRYIEGGTVVELSDGTLRYAHHSGIVFDSHDNGVTWDEGEKWTDVYSYVNIFRLKNGELIKIFAKNEYVISQTSDDDGKTWFDGGNICYRVYGNNTKAIAWNMNDKLTQMSSGRIFYCQNYEIKGETVNGRSVFCEFYYSDDNGKTWTKSETDSWTIPGNETETHFGECKILECDDGTLRMYNSWNNYPCVVYSESHDNGKTWGKLMPIPELICARSSLQFVRDRYADNDTTYYMVWVNSPSMGKGSGMTRSRLSLARSTNGKDWIALGDLWRWETRQMANYTHIAHVVDAFINTTRDYIICGAGYSEYKGPSSTAPDAPKDNYHHAQRQHIWSIAKDGFDI